MMSQYAVVSIVVVFQSYSAFARGNRRQQVVYYTPQVVEESTTHVEPTQLDGSSAGRILAEEQGTLLPFNDRHGRRVDACFFSRKPTMLVVTADEADKKKTESFMQDFIGGRAAKKVLEAGGKLMADPVGSIAGVMGRGLGGLNNLFRAPEGRSTSGNDSEKPPEKKNNDDSQFLFLTDTRSIWDQAYGVGWARARAMAHQMRPRAFDEFGNARGAFKRLKERKFQEMAGPQIAAQVPQAVFDMFSQEAEKSEVELKKLFNHSAYKLGPLFSQGESFQRFGALRIPMPQFQIIILDEKGRVSHRWADGNIDGKVIARKYDQLLEGFLKKNPTQKPLTAECDADSDGVANFDDFCPNTRKGDKPYLPAGPKPEWSGCAPGQMKGSGFYVRR